MAEQISTIFVAGFNINISMAIMLLRTRPSLFVKSAAIWQREIELVKCAQCGKIIPGEVS